MEASTAARRELDGRRAAHAGVAGVQGAGLRQGKPVADRANRRGGVKFNVI